MKEKEETNKLKDVNDLEKVEDVKTEKKNRLAKLEDRIIQLEKEEDEKKEKKIRKKFRLPLIFKKLSKKASKNPEFVFVMYLSMKNEVSYKVCRIVSGDVLVISNKAYVLDPKAVWKYKKTMFYIIKEIDRLPVSNLDYDKIVERGDDTSADVPLIKAVLGATNKSSGILKDKNIILWIVLGALALGAVVLFGGGAV